MGYGDCELIWTNIQRDSVKKYTVEYNGLIGKEAERFHPTQKPAALLSKLLQDYSTAGDAVVDWYCGTGTLLVASETTGRVAYGMEREVKYCSVTLERLSNMGLDPKRVESGKN